MASAGASVGSATPAPNAWTRSALSGCSRPWGFKLPADLSSATTNHVLVAASYPEWAEREGIHYQTAWRWWRDEKLPVLLVGPRAARSSWTCHDRGPGPKDGSWPTHASARTTRSRTSTARW